MDKAIGGDMQAVKEVLNRAEGAVTQRIEADGDIGLVINVIKFTEALENATTVENTAIEEKSMKTDT